jgi:hypothetical protein
MTKNIIFELIMNLMDGDEMLHYKSIIFCFISSLLLACTHSTKDQVYVISPKYIEEKGIKIDASLHADLKAGELILLMKIKNNSLDNIRID